MCCGTHAYFKAFGRRSSEQPGNPLLKELSKMDCFDPSEVGTIWIDEYSRIRFGRREVVREHPRSLPIR